jgi:selenocysteine lyase/cysteine desulfurase
VRVPLAIVQDFPKATARVALSIVVDWDMAATPTTTRRVYAIIGASRATGATPLGFAPRASRASDAARASVAAILTADSADPIRVESEACAASGVVGWED